MSNKSVLNLFLILSIIIAALVFPAPASAQSSLSVDFNDDGGKLVIGSFYHLKSGESLHGDLVIIGGQATIDPDSQVNGSLILTGGSVEIDGTVNGDVFAMGGSVNLLSNAIINGDVSTIGVNINRQDGSKINGNTNTINETYNFDLPFGKGEGFTGIQPGIDGMDVLRAGQNFLQSVFWKFFQALALAILAAVIALLAPDPTRRVARSIFNAPFISGAAGILTIFAAPAVLLLLIITIILIPVGLIGSILLGIAFLFGWIAIGYELGIRLAAAIKVDWAPAISTGVGTLMLSILAAGVGWIPCIGWILPAIVSVMGLGGVIISKFGTKTYQSSASNNTTASIEQSQLRVTENKPSDFNSPEDISAKIVDDNIDQSSDIDQDGLSD